MNTSFKILDCTIRDGGYLNGWDFDKAMVRDVYRGISKTGTDFIELGFRNANFKGKSIWQFLSEEDLREVAEGISGIPIALLLDHGNFSIEDISDSKKSLVSLYRVACHKDKVVDALAAAERIKDKGYSTTLQLMGIAGYEPGEIKKVVPLVKKSSLDYLYFADSYGSLYPDQVKGFIKILRETGKKIGFHAHNNLELAFANTLSAIECQVDIVDATIFGMGRGAGNLPLEVLITYLERMGGEGKYNSIPILDLIDRHFIALRKNLQWGYSLPYMLSGMFGVHPYYAKEMIDYSEFDMQDVARVLEIIKEKKPIGFNPDELKGIIKSGFVGSCELPKKKVENQPEKISGLLEKFKVDYLGRHKGKDFLVLANGPTLKKFKKEIDAFISKFDPVILGANFLDDLFTPDYHAFSNKKRLVKYIDKVHGQSRLLISSAFDKQFIEEYVDRPFETLVHLDQATSHFDIQDGVITSNCRTVAVLLIAAAIVMGAKRIFVVGLDGYKDKDLFLSNKTHFYNEEQEAQSTELLLEKHAWNEALLNSINEYLLARGQEGIHILTPTGYRNYYTSIFNWLDIPESKIHIGT